MILTNMSQNNIKTEHRITNLNHRFEFFCYIKAMIKLIKKQHILYYCLNLYNNQ